MIIYTGFDQEQFNLRGKVPNSLKINVAVLPRTLSDAGDPVSESTFLMMTNYIDHLFIYIITFFSRKQLL